MFPSLPLLLPLFVHYIIEKEEERESKATNQLIVMGWILALRIVVLRHASSKTNCSGQDTPAYSVKNMCTYFVVHNLCGKIFVGICIWVQKSFFYTESSSKNRPHMLSHTQYTAHIKWVPFLFLRRNPLTACKDIRILPHCPLALKLDSRLLGI